MDLRMVTKFFQKINVIDMAIIILINTTLMFEEKMEKGLFTFYWE